MSKVLVIDDSSVARKAMCELLRSAGHEVFGHDSPLGATLIILKQGINVVVLDMNMPAMSGERFAELIRRNSRMDHVAVVLVTGESEETLAAAGRRIKADAMLRKGDITAKLVATVESVTD